MTKNKLDISWVSQRKLSFWILTGTISDQIILLKPNSVGAKAAEALRRLLEFIRTDFIEICADL